MPNIDTGKYWDLPWSLVDGCTPISPGCQHCWAAQLAHIRAREGEPGYTEPLLTQKNRSGTPYFNGVVIPVESRLDIPKKRKKPAVYSIWNDFFHASLSVDFKTKAYRIMQMCPQHTFLILTKRAGYMHETLTNIEHYYNVEITDRPITMENVWHGITVCNQDEYLLAGDVILDPAPKISFGRRFLSIEPILGAIDLDALGPRWHIGVDLVIVGPETGPQRRYASPDWIEGVIDACDRSSVPVFVKQTPLEMGFISKNMLDWPVALRRRELPFFKQTPEEQLMGLWVEEKGEIPKDIYNKIGRS